MCYRKDALNCHLHLIHFNIVLLVCTHNLRLIVVILVPLLELEVVFGLFSKRLISGSIAVMQRYDVVCAILYQ